VPAFLRAAYRKISGSRLFYFFTRMPVRFGFCNQYVYYDPIKPPANGRGLSLGAS